MKDIDKSDYNFAEFMNFNIFYFSYFLSYFAIEQCEQLTQTRGGKELLETIRRNEFDVIVQDVTLNQCLYALWEVGKIQYE